ncbi:MAG: PilZ domain-containing protein [Endomicrobiales bacterium]|nr:PilZ domain-containing protein [Endomicrobiales bacterium]
MGTGKERRRYIRHPSDIPIEINVEGAAPGQEKLKNVSYGGICFRTKQAIEPGTVISIKISLVHPEFESKAKVVWCSRMNDHFNVGVEFVEIEDAFRVRMVEQICRIEKYKDEVKRKEGRALTGTQAALEWIKKYAKKFPGG